MLARAIISFAVLPDTKESIRIDGVLDSSPNNLIVRNV